MFRNIFQFTIGYFLKVSYFTVIKKSVICQLFFFHVMTVLRVVEFYVRCNVLFPHTTYNRRKILKPCLLNKVSGQIELSQPLILNEFATFSIGLLIILQSLFFLFSLELVVLYVFQLNLEKSVSDHFDPNNILIQFYKVHRR